MTASDEASDRPNKDVVRLLQEELSAIEPSADARKAMLTRILSRTVRSWREWLNRSRERPDD